MREKHSFTPKSPDVQASTATMNTHRHSRCHYKRNSGSTPAGMNNLHIGGPAGRQTPGGSPPTTTSAPTTAATCPPTPHQRAPAAPKRTDRSSLPSSPQERERDRLRTRVPPSRRTTCCATPRCSRPQSPGRRTECCTLARQQQFAFPRMAGGRLLRRARGWFPPPDAGGRSGSPAHAKAGPGSPRPPPQQG
jgi:hypothetical protein